jgi:hypothetical protein
MDRGAQDGQARRQTRPGAQSREAAQSAANRSRHRDRAGEGHCPAGRSWADTVLGIAGPATDMAFAIAGSRVTGPKKKAAIEKAGALLRQMREAAGLVGEGTRDARST